MVSQVKQLRCLIVDDNRDFINAATKLLEREGIKVVGKASSSAEGLLCFEQLRPDFALIDVDLGTESGFDLIDQLHNSGCATPPPVILISTHSEQDFAEMINASPAVGFLAKSALSSRAIHDLLLQDGNVEAGG
ncbi:response regulator [Mycobacterium sp.]|jgi:CheY-like chemotaxis protein|uniref:response regulator n=1 Tax=Mycobacterium sp. TaxID=1785 RepID=UPI002D35B16B|nr:response regulator [Mycobacterium sp.]HZA09698.1 response regulator [Mycobacterium sp.]